MLFRCLVFVLLSLSLSGLAKGQSQSTYDCRRLNDCMNGGSCTFGQTNCDCPDGFTGYQCHVLTGTDACTTKQCINDGLCYVETTDAGPVEKCGCAYGFYGDTCLDETLMVTCNGESVEFLFTFPEVFDGVIQLSGDTIPDVCAFTETTLDGMKTYSLTIDTTQDTVVDACGRDVISVVGDAATDANYTGSIEVRYFQTIVAETDELYTLTCSHQGDNVEISKEITNINVNPQGNLTQVEKIQPYSPVDFELVDMEGSVLPAVMYVGDPYKICFFLTDVTVYKQVFISSCTTNNTVEDPGTKTYDIYSQGCPTRKGMITTSIQESASKTIEGVDFPSVCLPIKAFKFVDSNNVAISCQIKLCKEGNLDCTIPTKDECTTIMDTPPTTAAPTDAPGGDGGTGDATGNTGDGAGDAGDGTGDTGGGTGDAGGTDGGTAGNGGGTDGETGVRRRRAADGTDNTEEKTVTTMITVLGDRDFTSDQSQGQKESSVEECLSQTEIMAVVTVLASVVIVLFIACFILICILMKRKSKMTVFEPHSDIPKPERFRIPRAHVNQAYGEI